MDYFNNADLCSTTPVAEDFDECLDFDLALAIEATNIQTFCTLDEQWWNLVEQPDPMAGPSVDVFVQGSYGEYRVHRLGRFAFNLLPPDAVAPVIPQSTQAGTYDQQPHPGQQLPEPQMQLRSQWTTSTTTLTSSSLHPPTLDSIPMDYFYNNTDLYHAIPVAEDFDACLDFNLASAIGATDIQTLCALDYQRWSAIEQPDFMAGPSVDVFVQGNYGKHHVRRLSRFAFNLLPPDAVAPAIPQSTEAETYDQQPHPGRQLPEPEMQPKSSSLANWGGSLDAAPASELAILAPAPSCGNNPLCSTPLRTRMLTDREQLPSPPGVTTRARKTPSHPSR